VNSKHRNRFGRLANRYVLLAAASSLAIGGVLLISSNNEQPPVQAATATNTPAPSSTSSFTDVPVPSPPVTAAPLPEKTFNKSSVEVTAQPAAAAPILSPSTLSIPSLGVTAPIVPGDANGGSMILPISSKVAEYSSAAPLTATKGSTVIAGHVNFADGSAGALGPLYKITQGAAIYATDVNGKTHEYKVTAMNVLSKQSLPYDIFRTAGSRQLVLVTCGGTIEKVNGVYVYTHNLVVTAEPV